MQTGSGHDNGDEATRPIARDDSEVPHTGWPPVDRRTFSAGKARPAANPQSPGGEFEKAIRALLKTGASDRLQR